MGLSYSAIATSSMVHVMCLSSVLLHHQSLFLLVDLVTPSSAH